LLRSVIHTEQLKLLLADIDFLVNKLNPKRYYKTHIIYIGAAKSLHLKQLIMMFPDIKFELIDSTKFDKDLLDFVKDNTNINVINKVFDVNIANDYHNRLIVEQKKSVLFICNIRRNRGFDNIAELELHNDNIKQEEWISILKPDWTLIRFRIPRLNNIDQTNIISDNGDYKYLSGDIIIQCFATQSSTETCMIIKKNAKRKNYNLDEYEGKLHYHNRISRSQYYEHEFNVKGFDHCYDCTNMFMILQSYKNKFIKSKSTAAYAGKTIEKIVNDIYHNLKLQHRIKYSHKIF